MIETRHLKNVVIFVQTILSFVLSRKIINICKECKLVIINFNVLPCLGNTLKSQYCYSGPFQFMMGSKFNFSQNCWKHIFFNSLINFLKLEAREYLIHSIWNVNSLILWTLPVLFLTVKVKLGADFSQFIRRFEIKICGCWLNFQVFPNSQINFGIFECCCGWTSQFFLNSEKNWKIAFFEHKPRFYC